MSTRNGETQKSLRYVVVGADGHIGPRIEEYREYCLSNYKGATKLSRMQTANSTAGGWVPVAHTTDMESQGIASEFIFHGVQGAERGSQRTQVAKRSDRRSSMILPVPVKIGMT